MLRVQAPNHKIPTVGSKAYCLAYYVCAHRGLAGKIKTEGEKQQGRLGYATASTAPVIRKAIRMSQALFGVKKAIEPVPIEDRTNPGMFYKESEL